MTKIKTKGKQVISVPNTQEGQEFLSHFSRYANHKQFAFKKHGRGGGEGRDTPVSKAKWIALYSYDKGAPEERSRIYKWAKEDKQRVINNMKNILQKNLTYDTYVKLEPIINEGLKWDI